MRELAIPYLVLLSSMLAIGACSDNKKNSVDEATKEAACESNADCQQGEVCLAKVCASAAPGAIYTNPSNAVTPDKVKAQMDMVNKAAEERVDKILEEAEGQ